MTSFEIYWHDLNQSAKKRLKALWHENIDLSPIAIIDIEEDNDNPYFEAIEEDV